MMTQTAEKKRKELMTGLPKYIHNDLDLIQLSQRDAKQTPASIKFEDQAPSLSHNGQIWFFLENGKHISLFEDLGREFCAVLEDYQKILI